MDSSKDFVLLLVEDQESDVKIMKRVLRKSGLPARLKCAGDGEEALSKLRQWVSEPDSVPDVIMLDINMPKMDGFSFLENYRKDELIRHIPVIVFTSSDSATDIKKAYSLGAASYIQKPLEFEKLEILIKDIFHYWKTVVRLSG